MRKTESFYDRFFMFYPLVDIFLKPQKRVLLQEINKQASGQLLEIGVGNGAHLPLYKTHQITGIDTSSKMLEIARRRKANDVKLLQMNGEDLSFSHDSFDYVVLSHVIAVVDNPEKLIEEVFRVLKADGQVFILNHVTPDNRLKMIDHFLSGISKLLHLRSVFYIKDLAALQKFQLIKEVELGLLSYFKLLIYQKK